MKYFFLNTILLLCNVSVFSQAYVYNYGGAGNDSFRAIEKHPQGGFVALGTTGSELQSQTDMFLVRVDDQLHCLWSLNLGGNGVEQGRALSVDADGNILAVGYSVEDPSFGYQNFAVKVDANGQELWQKRWGTAGWDLAAAVAVDGNNSFWVASNAIATTGEQSISLNHLDGSGNVTSTFVANTSLVDEAVKLKFYNDSLYLLVNTSDDFIHSTAVRQIAVNGGMGISFASQRSNVTGYDFDISPYGLLLVGSYFTPENENYYAILFDMQGNQSQEQLFTASVNAYYTGVTHNSNSFNLVGNTNSFGAGEYDALIHRFGPNADWWGGGSVGTVNMDEASALICVNDTLYAVGYSNGFELGLQNQATITKAFYDINNLTPTSSNQGCFFVGIAEEQHITPLWLIKDREASWNSTVAIDEVSVYNLTGQCLYRSTSAKQIPLNFPAGVYVIRTQSTGQVSVQTFIR